MLKLTLGLALLNWDESVDRFWAPFIKKKKVWMGSVQSWQNKFLSYKPTIIYKMKLEFYF